jgi:hypothetical protein
MTGSAVVQSRRTDAGMAPRRRNVGEARAHEPIQVVKIGGAFRLVRPGARYAVLREGEEHRGAWLAADEVIDPGWTDAYPEHEARSLLPFLRGQAARRRPATEPTSADGRLIQRACRGLGVSASGLARMIGAHESVLSRARHGDLPEVHRESIRALLKARK